MSTTFDENEIHGLERLGHTLLEHGKLDDAQRLFAGLSSLAPQSWYAYHGLGVIARERKEYERAGQCFKHASTLAGVSDMHSALAYGEVCILMRNVAEARGALARVMQALPHQDPLHERARCLMQTLKSR